MLNIPAAKNYIARKKSELELNEKQKAKLNFIEIHGLPGAGKASVVSQWINRNKDDLGQKYKLVAWIECSDISQAYRDIEIIAKQLPQPYQGKDPQEAYNYLLDYCKNNKTLLVLNHVEASDVFDAFKAFQDKARIIYTTTQDNLADLSEKEVVEVLPFDETETQDFLNSYFKDLANKIDVKQLIACSGGLPFVMRQLLQKYSIKYSNINHFLASLKSGQEPTIYQQAISSLIASTQDSLKQLNEEAEADPKAASALNFIKQAAYLADAAIPFAFFQDEHSQDVDYEALNKLNSYGLTFVTYDRDTRSYTLLRPFQAVIQQLYPTEALAILQALVARLSKVFDFQVINDFEKKPRDLMPYAAHVHHLLAKINSLPTKADKAKLDIAKVTILWSSLSRYYYHYYGELDLALKQLNSGKAFIKNFLDTGLIKLYKHSPTTFAERKANKQIQLTDEQRELLKLYAREILYQIGTIHSQLVSRRSFSTEATIIETLKQSYNIQRNLFDEAKIPSLVDKKAMAFTLRNLTRALRKQGGTTAKTYYNELEVLVNDKASLPFDEITKAQLLFDQGIIEKENQDKLPKEQRHYGKAIKLLEATEHCYQQHNSEQDYNYDLATLSIYLGDAYKAQGEIAKAVVAFHQVINYCQQSEVTVVAHYARAYHELAKLLSEQGYYALAQSYGEKALNYQIKTYGEKHKRVEDTLAIQLRIQEALLAQPMVQISEAKLADYHAIKDKSEHFSQQLFQLAKVKQPNFSGIEEKLREANAILFYELQQQQSKAAMEQEKDRLTAQQQIIADNTKKREEAESLQQQQVKQWYQLLKNKISLGQKERQFEAQFQEELLYRFVQQLRIANGKDSRMSRKEVGTEIAKELMGILPKIKTNGVTITGELDLAAVLKGCLEVELKRYRAKKVYESNTVADLFDNDTQKFYDKLREYTEAMADYAARCYQPLLVKLNADDNGDDIDTLAKCGAKRVMQYHQSGRIGLTASLEELVIVALLGGHKDKRLTQKIEHSKIHHWHARGFFKQPGVKVSLIQPGEIVTPQEKQEASKIYIPNRNETNLNIYGYRYGSLFEVKHLGYEESTDTKEANKNLNYQA